MGILCPRTPSFLKIGVPNPEEYHLEVGKAVLIRKTIFFRDVESREEFCEKNKIKFVPPRYPGPDFDYFEADLEECLRVLFPNAVVTCVRTGTWSGYGHGRETIRAQNGDGTLIYECTWIAHCEGPGYSCSYDHGPWYKYGQIKNIPIPVDPETRIAEAVLRYFDGKYPSIELKKLALKVLEEHRPVEEVA